MTEFNLSVGTTIYDSTYFSLLIHDVDSCLQSQQFSVKFDEYCSSSVCLCDPAFRL